MRSELGLPGDSKDRGMAGQDLEKETADLLSEPASKYEAGIRDCVAAIA